MNRSAAATISKGVVPVRAGVEQFVTAEILAAHKELDELDVPRTFGGEALSLSQRVATLRIRLDQLRVNDLPPAYGKQIPGGAEAWARNLRS